MPKARRSTNARPTRSGSADHQELDPSQRARVRQFAEALLKVARENGQGDGRGLCVSFSPLGAPLTLSPADILAMKKRADRGLPVPWEATFLPGSIPQIVLLPMLESPPPKPAGKPGRPPAFTDEEWAVHVAKFPLSLALSPRRRATLITGQISKSRRLKKPISSSTVRRRILKQQ